MSEDQEKREERRKKKHAAVDGNPICSSITAMYVSSFLDSVVEDDG